MGFGKDSKGVIMTEHPNTPLGTLANETGLVLSSDEAGPSILERFRIIKSEITAEIQAATAASGDGPLEVIMFDGAFSLAEISAAILAVGPSGPNEQVEIELSERWWKSFGLISFAGEAAGPGALLQEGMVVEKTIRWTFARAKGWRFLIWNWGTALTTGSTALVRAKHFGVWVI